MAAINTALKWTASGIRVAIAKMRLRSRLRLPRGGKPVYLGRGVRLIAGSGGCIKLGTGAYIDDQSRLQVGESGLLSIGDYDYLNTNCRLTAIESITVGNYTMFGPNCCIFDHDHVFNAAGVSAELVSSPVSIGEKCWLCANVVITRGVKVADRCIVAAGAVATHDCVEGAALYAGMPAKLVKRFFSFNGSENRIKASE